MNFRPLISLRLDRARKFLGSWEEQPTREVRRVGVTPPALYNLGCSLTPLRVFSRLAR